MSFSSLRNFFKNFVSFDFETHSSVHNKSCLECIIGRKSLQKYTVREGKSSVEIDNEELVKMSLVLGVEGAFLLHDYSKNSL